MNPRRLLIIFGSSCLALTLTFILLYGLAWAGHAAAPASPTAPTQVSFQGKVTSNGLAYNGVGYFKFAVVNAAGTSSYWSNDNTSTAGSAPTAMVPLNVTSGLFTVLLGDTTQSGMSLPLNPSVFAAPDRHLRVWFSTTGLTGSFEQLTPDFVIGAVPFALNAETLDGLDSSAFAANDHTHSGADIVTGTLDDARLPDNVVMNGQGVSRLNNDAGYVTQTLADRRYARINPTTQQIAQLKWYTAITNTVATFAVGINPNSMAFDGENIWVTDWGSAMVHVLRASTGALVFTTTTGTWPYGIAFDGVNMWVANMTTNNVSVLRARDGYHVMTITTVLAPSDVAFDGANIWVVNSTGNNVSVLRASNGAPVMTPTVGNAPIALAFDGINMWIANRSDNTVSVLRASDGAHVMTPTVGAFPRRLAFDGVNMWVANYDSNNVSVVRASDGYHVMTLTVGTNPDALAFDGANMWVANNNSYTLSIFRASDGAPIATLPSGVNPGALAFDGAFMWVANAGNNTVSKR
ncbi:MAG TPA: YncE family protein [Anaerolineae bacterium]|nr:YncE family protein [Anaerolineae bacterium]